jgi:hypothetical protein
VAPGSGRGANRGDRGHGVERRLKSRGRRFDLGRSTGAVQEAAAAPDEDEDFEDEDFEDEDFEDPLPFELPDAALDDPEDPSDDLAVEEESLDLVSEEAAGLEDLEAERLSVL